MAGGSCGVCELPAMQCCSGCHSVYYCSREHQKQHWNVHKVDCKNKSYQISHSEILGRHFIASKEIPPGAIIFKEKPLVVGPKVSSLPLCLGCNLRITEANSDTCSGCNWPMCGPECEKSALHVDECKLMRERGFRANIYDLTRIEAAYCCITPLRCLLLKNKNINKWKTLMDLESHLEDRRDTPLYRIFKSNVVEFMHNVLKLNDFQSETILSVCGILDTNSFELRKSDGNVKVRGLFPLAAMMAHDCTPNTKHYFEDDFTMTVKSTVTIKKGEPITTTYTQTLWETLSRRVHIRAAKCFDCTCKRCSDPSELHAFVGAILCSACKNNNERHSSKIVSTKPLDHLAPWRCQSCGFEMKGAQVVEMNGLLRKEIAALDKSSPRALEDFLTKNKDTLHPTNTHVLEVKYALTQIYGHVNGYSHMDLSDEQLGRKVELCKQLLQVASVLDPGASRLRGLLLMDMQEAMVVQASRSGGKGKRKSNKKSLLHEAMEALQEAGDILQGETGMKDKWEKSHTEISRETMSIK